MQAALAAKPDALITSIVDNNAFDDLIKDARDEGRHRHRLECRRHRRRQGQCAPGLHRPGLHSGRLYARQGAVGELPEGRARSRCWSASSRPARTGRSSAPQGVMNVHGGVQGGQSEPRGHDRAHRRRHRPRRRRRSRRRLSQRPSGHDRLFRHRLLACRRRARADATAASRPARCCSAASTWCRKCLQQMKAGYIQVQIDQQPYSRASCRSWRSTSTKTVGLAPADIDTGQGVVHAGPGRCDHGAWPRQGVR